MIYGDLLSIFQLGVALNLGFGALVVFSEPTKREFDRNMQLIEDRLYEVSLYVQSDNQEDNVGEIDALYDINKSYCELAAYASTFKNSSYLWRGFAVRSLFLSGGVISFTGLIILSYFAKQSANQNVFIIGLVVNIVPILSAIILFVFSYKYHQIVLPKLEKLHKRLSNFFLLTEKY